MFITVRVVPRASAVSIKQEDDILKVRLTRPAHEGEANRQLIDVLADYFKVQKHRVRLVHGAGSRTKMVEITDA